ncbi:hypothetical protein L2755_21115 [Shewanella abyssi]|uniref:hypothetical protein n=1 Tax=Shewanella abyssi TaxID=311789 RepID=UPI00200D4406|nr:hypothetical protein [Shewanella abyssi]MCL1052100.1 hypothetical protein [Shewanella abyssi]
MDLEKIANRAAKSQWGRNALAADHSGSNDLRCREGCLNVVIQEGIAIVPLLAGALRDYQGVQALYPLVRVWAKRHDFDFDLDF